MCTTTSLITPEIQNVLCECLKCMIVYTEDHSGCLEGMLQIGLRNKIITLLQTEYLLTNDIIKYSLHALAILCGYTHCFDSQDNNDSTQQIPVSSIPVIVGINEQMLFEILLIISNLLNRSISITTNPHTGANSTTVNLDEIIIINIGILCQYLLPLCQSSDPMYQVIQI